MGLCYQLELRYLPILPTKVGISICEIGAKAGYVHSWKDHKSSTQFRRILCDRKFRRLASAGTGCALSGRLNKLASVNQVMRLGSRNQGHLKQHL